MIGERLLDLRKSAGMTQDDLAEVLSINKHSISAYERDKSEPPDDIKIAIADYFDVSLDYLLGVTTIPFRCAKRENIFCFLRIFRKTPIRSCPVLSNT